MPSPLEEIFIVNRMRVYPKSKVAFVDWQAKLNADIAAFPGFVSLEIQSPPEPGEFDWTIVERFYDKEKLETWRTSETREQLFKELEEILYHEKDAIHEESAGIINQPGSVTEVFVTQLSPDKERAYREWAGKIHQVEAKFPGFKGVYVQSPTSHLGRNWITLLQFDTPENLDRWLNSPERQEVLQESKPLIASLESHRVISPYAGWFASISKEGESPSVWKQTMVVLLVLFPIVMFELRFLSPITAKLNSSLATFIGNAISVVLISWPMMPLAIRFLGWWLSPKPGRKKQANVVGTLVVLIIYVVEIAIFWKFL